MSSSPSQAPAAANSPRPDSARARHLNEAPADGKPRLEPTLPGRLRAFALTRGHEPALRHKRLGLWEEITWAQYYRNVSAAARMLAECGLGPGDHIAILSDNRPQWLYADLAAQALGARSVGLYATSPASDVAYLLNHSGSKVLFCEDQEQVDKFMAVADQLPALEKVVVFDPRGTRGYSDARLLHYRDFMAQGEALLDGDGAFMTRCIAALDPDAPAMVVYTSGTTGHPKGAMISNRNACEMIDAFTDLIEFEDHEQGLSYLPLCHVAEKIFSVFLPLTKGMVVHFGESIETVQEDLREVSPTLFLGVPRIWEKIHTSVNIKLENASWLKRALAKYFLEKGHEIQTRRRERRATAIDGVMWFLGDMLIYRALQERLGLRRCRLAATGAAPIAPEMLEWFRSFGVLVHEGYGMTELSGVSHINPPEQVRLGTVGLPIRSIEERIADDGEILLRGPSIFVGYLNDEEATRATIDSDGWLHTGDVGKLEDGYLTITGRKKEIIITAGGKNLSPERIENALKASSYVKEVIAIGDRRKFVAALVQIEYDTVGNWAQGQGIQYTSYQDLASKDEVQALLAKEIARCNDVLARVEQVRSFRILPRQLQQEEGELTPTQKVRRSHVHARYAELIETMYTSA
ncbi:MAG: AMP-binding protein [Myxococcales bacterium]|nr:AMP-binding protein [Myxococcales bacterium]